MTITNKNWAEAIYFDGRTAWVVSCCYPILCCYDLELKTVSSVIPLPQKYRMDWYRTFCRIEKNNGYLYLIPSKKPIILKYDIDNRVFSEIDLSTMMSIEDASLYGIIREKDYLYISSTWNGIFRINLKDDTITKQDSDCGCHIWPNYNRNNKGYIVAAYDSNIVFLLDESFKKTGCYQFGDEAFRYTAAICKNDMVYAMLYGAEENILVKYDVRADSYSSYNIRECVGRLDYCANYIGSFIYGDEVIFLPSNCGENIIAFNIVNETINVKELVEGQEKYAFSTLRECDGGYYTYEINSSNLYYFNISGEIKKFEILLGDIYENELVKIRMSNKKLINESEVENLNRFLECIRFCYE